MFDTLKRMAIQRLVTKMASNSLGAAATEAAAQEGASGIMGCLLYTSPSPRDRTRSRMPSSA